MRIEDLSVNERILVHLKDFTTDPENDGATMGQTQEGIGEAVGIRINHVPRATNALLENGYVGETLVHIGGLKRKRKAFFLTTRGMEMTLDLIAKLREQKVKFRDSEGREKNLAIMEILFGARGVSPSKIILSYFRDGVVLDTALSGVGGEIYISNLDTLPIPDNFVNRTHEMRTLRKILDSGEKLIVISGIKGIGKTSLVRKVLKELEGKKNIFWYSAHEWDSIKSVLERISEFYVQLGRNELKKYTRLSRDVDVGQSATAFFKDMHNSDSIVVIDNIFDLKREVMQFIHLISEQSHRLDNSNIIFITRDRDSLRSIPCLSDMGSNDLVVGGLERESAMALMMSMGMEHDDGDRVFAMTQGHPLAIKLVNSDEIKRIIDTKGLTKEEVWVVRCMKAFDAILND
ncbi:MAG: AAA family ATPase [Candidatus Thermoplasmatota archaeon]|nr:AAA family ATPase [Candidatus Thermoplasmatota archaeon]MBU4071764.1 AAA family ATPase [Candidatus Thermoplasmatota archaeon]MBU4144228.1 AAA family ATPase [Candidatus Thermoplasmatota archaeon]MBU4591984.1 AAA family ATPase [Candidatus Thermoplasmatota archaeon]